MIATRFSVATHILLMMAADPDCRLTSPRIAGSVNTNPVVVRRIMRLLANAGLIRVRRGQGGAALGRPAERITLDDVWIAVNPTPAPPLLPVHPRPDPSCPVGRHVPRLLSESFSAAEEALRSALALTSLAAMLSGLAAAEQTQPVLLAQSAG